MSGASFSLLSHPPVALMGVPCSFTKAMAALTWYTILKLHFFLSHKEMQDTTTKANAICKISNFFLANLLWLFHFVPFTFCSLCANYNKLVTAAPTIFFFLPCENFGRIHFKWGKLHGLTPKGSKTVLILIWVGLEPTFVHFLNGNVRIKSQLVLLLWYNIYLPIEGPQMEKTYCWY